MKKYYLLLHFFSDEDWQKLQNAILDKTTESNPYLASSAIPSLDKSLKTTSKRIIKAINEVKSSVDTVNAKFITFSDSYNIILGDTFSNPQLTTDLNKV